MFLWLHFIIFNYIRKRFEKQHEASDCTLQYSVLGITRLFRHATKTLTKAFHRCSMFRSEVSFGYPAGTVKQQTMRTPYMFSQPFGKLVSATCSKKLDINLLVTDFFFQILAHPVFKM